MTALKLLVLLPLVALTHGRSFRWYCNILREPLVELAIDPVTNRHVRINGTRVRRHLQHFAKSESSTAFVASAANRTTNTSGWSTFLARKCWCTDRFGYGEDVDYYCVAGFAQCGIPTFWEEPEDVAPGCLNYDVSRERVLSMWPFVIVWYVMLLVCLVATSNGRGVIDFCITQLCWSSWNSRVVERIMQRDPNRVRTLLVQYLRRRRRLVPLEGPPQMEVIEEEIEVRRGPARLELETKIFSAREEEVDCTICFAVIEDGERVGALPCEHIFHKECLKTWLRRRNTCPLCQTENVAKPVYEEEITARRAGGSQGGRTDLSSTETTAATAMSEFTI